MHGAKNHERAALAEPCATRFASLQSGARLVTPESEELCAQALRPSFRLRQFDQYYLPIDLRHCAWIATALFASKYPEKG